MAGKYHLRKGVSGKFHFTLTSTNGEPILTSESYEAKASALHGIESVRKNSADDARYEIRGTHFILRAANGEPIGTSENYSSDGAMRKGMESAKANGPTATVADEIGG